MIKIIQGNLFDSKADIIAHQVNCQGIMGSGVARQVKKKYPTVFDMYEDMCITNTSKNLLGIAQICIVSNDTIIANLFAQDSYGYHHDGKQYTDLSALYCALSGLRRYALYKDFSIAIPYKIGCARGGADWENEVFPMIQTLFKNANMEIWKLAEGTNDNEL